ncbi:MAG: hypothetical protein M1837_002385 [Sclerophora amabilis]|nr:MAG: hypothetical protein M1837_002385 [Sclerophora amabilis]
MAMWGSARSATAAHRDGGGDKPDVGTITAITTGPGFGSGSGLCTGVPAQRGVFEIAPGEKRRAREFPAGDAVAERDGARQRRAGVGDETAQAAAAEGRSGGRGGVGVHLVVARS